MPRLLSRRGLLFVVAASIAATGSIANTSVVSAPDAHQSLQSNDIILIDIRSRGEWDETGVAKGAYPISMHEQGFGERLQAILKSTPPEKIGLICATGGRTAYVVDILEKNGISGVQDVSEGMLGNDRGPGWIARGLPTVSTSEALRFRDEKLAK